MTTSDAQNRINGLYNLLLQREALFVKKSDDTQISLQKSIIAEPARTALIASLITSVKAFVPATEQERTVKLSLINNCLQMQEEELDTVSNASTMWVRLITGDQRSQLVQEASATAVMEIVSTNA